MWENDGDMICHNSPTREFGGIRVGQFCKGDMGKLEFTKGKTNWGYKLRFGLFEVSAVDMKLIGRSMKIEL